MLFMQIYSFINMWYALSMNKKEKGWAIYFTGSKKDPRAGLCWWGNYDTGQIYKTKTKAQRAMVAQFKLNKSKDWKKLVTNHFKIVECKIHFTTPIANNKRKTYRMS